MSTPEPLSAKIAAYAVTPTMRDAFVARCAKDKITGAEGSRRAMAAWLAEPPKPPPVVVTEPGRPVPADAIWVHPSGNDANPGTQAKPRRTPVANKPNAFEGTFAGFSYFANNGTSQSWYVPPGKTATFDGQGGVPRALTAGGKVNLFGDMRFTNYAPTYSTDNTCVPVFFGGTAAGSEIDGPSVVGSKMAALGFMVPLLLTKFTVTDAGYSGILGTTADGTTFGDVRVSRVNRSGRSQDGQLGAIKMTRSKGLRFTKGVLVEDTGGAQGIWTDVSCRDTIASGVRVLTAGGKPAEVGLHFEEQQGGIVAGCELEGVFGLQLKAAGGIRAWVNKVTATSVAMNVQQDRPKNDGSNPANLPPAVAPWWTVGNEVCNNELVSTGGHQIAFMAYADGPAKGMLDAPMMLSALRGNTFGGAVQLGKLDGTRPTRTPAQIAVLLDGKYAAERQAVPVDIAALLK
jgi:hypothetical protein